MKTEPVTVASRIGPYHQVGAELAVCDCGVKQFLVYQIKRIT